MPSVVTKNYEAAYRDAIAFEAGTPVQVERGDPEFPEWYWCRLENGREGWVHRSFLQATAGQTISVGAYDAAELTVAAGECVEVLQVLGGWARVSAPDGRTGWIPATHLAAGLGREDE